MVDRSTSFFEINDVIKTSLPLLKIIYLLANDWILSDTLLFLMYFSVYGKTWWNLDSVNKFNSMTPY